MSTIHSINLHTESITPFILLLVFIKRVIGQDRINKFLPVIRY